MINQYLKPLLLVGLVAVLTGLIYSNIEFYQEKEKTPWSTEALRNPYLAAQYFLQQGGVEVKSADSLVTLDQLQDVSTVLITDVNQVVNPRQLEKVLEWLKQGGNLIVAASLVSEENDLLVEKFNVGVERYLDDQPVEDVAETGDEANDKANDADQKDKSLSDLMREYNKKIDEGLSPEEIAQSFSENGVMTKVNFGEEIGILEIAFNPQTVLTHPSFDTEEDTSEPKPFSWSSSDNGIHMLQFEVGNGLLTIISDPGIWTSKRINQFDHAYLLWMLISTDGDVALFKPVGRQSLWSLAVDSASEVLIALALVVFLSLWHLGHRFGRVETDHGVGSRSLGEHFSATANYLWRRKAIDYLLSPVRNKVMRRAAYACPAINRTSEIKDKWLLISQHCEIDFKTVEKAFNSTQHNEITFVQTVRLLKQIEKLL